MTDCRISSLSTERLFLRSKRRTRLIGIVFRNNGDGTFTDVTESAGLKGLGYSMGAAAGDYDNDGFVDLYVSRGESQPAVS